MAAPANRLFGLPPARAASRAQTGLGTNTGLSHANIIYKSVAEVNGRTC